MKKLIILVFILLIPFLALSEEGGEEDIYSNEYTHNVEIISYSYDDGEVVFSADVELTNMLGIVTIQQDVKVFNYFYDRTTRKYAVPMETTVKNTGMDAYLRVYLNAFRTVKATGEDEAIDWSLVEVGLLDENGNFLTTTTDYVLLGDCLYMTQPTPSGQSIYIDYYGWLNNYQHLATSSYIKTLPSSEAVQKYNFYPDFTSNDPWNSINIEQQNTNIDNAVSKFALNVTIGNQDDINADPPEDTGYKLPGDTTSFEVTIKMPATGYLYHFVIIRAADAALREILTDELTVYVITDDGEEQQINWYGKVGEYVKDTILKFIYKLNIPETLNNPFVGDQFQIKDEYIVVATPSPTPTSTPTPTPTLTPTPTPSPTPTSTATATPTPSPTPTSIPTATPTATPTPTLTPTSTPTITPTPLLLWHRHLHQLLLLRQHQ